jgi:hypothetical protein
VDDANAMRIAREIAQKVEADMTYPGEVKSRSSAKSGRWSMA